MKKLMKTLAVVLAFVLAVDAPVSASTVAAANLSANSAKATEYGDGNEDKYGDGNEDKYGDGNEDKYGDGDENGYYGDGLDIARIEQVIAVSIAGTSTVNLDMESKLSEVLEANVITVKNDKGEEVDWNLEWESDDTSVATVNKTSATTCQVTAVAGGSATVTATAYVKKNGKYVATTKSASVKVVVKQYATRIWFAGYDEQYYVKHKVDMNEYLQKDPDTATDDIYWSSSNTKLATVDAKGVVTMKKATGTEKVTITAATERGASASMTFAIEEGNPITKIKVLSAKKPVLAKKGAEDTVKVEITTKKSGETTDILTWTSAKPAIVTVEADEAAENSTTYTATITAVGVGSSKVTVKASSGKSASVTVTAKAELKTLEVVDENDNTEGDTYPLKKVTLKAVRYGEDGEVSLNSDKIKWTVDDAAKRAKIATVSGKKNDTALVTIKTKTLKDGETQNVYVTATVGTVSGTYKLTVNASGISNITKVEGVNTLQVGESAMYQAVLSGADFKDVAEQVTWASSSAKVLSVEMNEHSYPVVTALKSGSATLKATVTTTAGKTVTKSLKIKVTQPITTLAMKKNPLTVVAGKAKSVTFTAVKTPKDSKGVITYSTDYDKASVPNATKGKVAVAANAVAGDVITVTATADTGVTTEGEILVLGGKTVITMTPKLDGNAVAYKSNKFSMEQGTQVDLNAVSSNENDPVVSYTMSKKGIVSVDEDGTVYGLFPGKTKITVQTLSGVKKAVTVTVTKAASAPDNYGDGYGDSNK